MDDKTRVIAEWLNQYNPDTYSYDIERDAFRDLTYEQFLQVQEWAGTMDTVGEMQEHLDPGWEEDEKDIQREALKWDAYDRDPPGS